MMAMAPTSSPRLGTHARDGKESPAGLGSGRRAQVPGRPWESEAGAAGEVAEAEGEAGRSFVASSEDFGQTEEIAAVEATAETQGTQMELKGGTSSSWAPALPAPGGRDQVAVEAPQDAKRWNSADDMGWARRCRSRLPVRPLPGMKAKRLWCPKVAKTLVQELTKCGLGDHIHEFWEGGRVAGLEGHEEGGSC